MFNRFIHQGSAVEGSPTSDSTNAHLQTIYLDNGDEEEEPEDKEEDEEEDDEEE